MMGKWSFASAERREKKKVQWKKNYNCHQAPSTSLAHFSPSLCSGCGSAPCSPRLALRSQGERERLKVPVLSLRSRAATKTRTTTACSSSWLLGPTAPRAVSPPRSFVRSTAATKATQLSQEWRREGSASATTRSARLPGKSCCADC